MIFVAPNTQFTADVENFPTGLVGQVGVRILDSNGVAVVARTVVGIVESPAGSGHYIATLLSPALTGTGYSVFWDTGAVTPFTTAAEDLTVTVSGGVPGDQNYQPTVQQVADHLQSRTRDKWGNLQKTFNAQTTPSDVDVQRIILQASTKVADEIGDTVPDIVVDDAQDLVAIRTAMMIETSFFSEQVDSSRSPYTQLSAEYERELPRLLAAVQSAAEDGNIKSAQVANRPSYSFPEASTKITMDSVW